MDSIPYEIYKEIFNYLPDVLTVSLVSKLWYSIVNKHYPWNEVVLVVDITGSVSYWLYISKWIIDNIKDQFSNRRLRFRLVCYTDHDGETELIISTSLTRNYTEIKDFVNKIIERGGGDFQEAVLDGLLEAKNTNWSENAIKTIILCLDAPPHGRMYYKGSSDAFPDGCPCGLTQKCILPDFFKRDIRLKIMYPFQQSEFLLDTIKNFREDHPRIEEYPFSTSSVGVLLSDIFKNLK